MYNIVYINRTLKPISPWPITQPTNRAFDFCNQTKEMRFENPKEEERGASEERWEIWQREHPFEIKDLNFET